MRRPCKAEAVGLANKAAGFSAQTGIPLSYFVVLNEDGSGNPPSGKTAKVYEESLGLMGFPVTADPTGQLYRMTTWTGSPRPGKCALAPDMTIISCWVGADDSAGFEAIAAHAARGS